MSYRFSQIDAFTRKPFKGNPAVVMLLDKKLSDEVLQNIALEMNVSETAFLWRTGEDGSYQLRWFTPKTEVDLCGHATLASAHMIYEDGIEPFAKKLKFETKSGVLRAERRDQHLCIFLKKQSYQHLEKKDFTDADSRALAWFGNDDWIVAEYAHEDDVADYKGDLDKMSFLKNKSLIITAPSKTSQRDFVSRVFAPNLGIPEDPVTGSAHCVLAPYWAAKLDRNKLIAEQISARSGVLHLEMQGDTVMLSGFACTTFKGILTAKL